MKKDLSLPLVLYVAEFIYLKIHEIKNNNNDLNNIDAFEIFMGTNEFDEISSGKFHDVWFEHLKNNNFIDKLTGKKVSEETLKLLVYVKAMSFGVKKLSKIN